MYKLSPSKAHRFLNCTASLKHDVPFTETPFTIRGNLLHSYAEMKLKLEDTRNFEVANNLNDYEIWLITTYVKEVLQEYNNIFAYHMEVENKQPIKIFGFDINLIIDVLLIGHDTISVIDLKTGNADVEAKDNEQLLFYGYAALMRFNKIKKVRTSIFQKGKMKTEEKTPTEIYDFFLSKYDIFNKIQKNELEYNPSDKACKYCAIKDSCIARSEWILGEKYGAKV